MSTNNYVREKVNSILSFLDTEDRKIVDLWNETSYKLGRADGERYVATITEVKFFGGAAIIAISILLAVIGGFWVSTNKPCEDAILTEQEMRDELLSQYTLTKVRWSPVSLPWYDLDASATLLDDGVYCIRIDNSRHALCVLP